MHAEQKYLQLMSDLKKFLNSKEAEESRIPLKEWESRYTQLKAIREWWDIPWDEIEREVKKTPYPETWIWESRGDPAFKKYYALRMELDKMETLMK